MGLIDVFQSTSPTSLVVGQNWLDNITDALRNCEVMIVLCSPFSVNRPWINFECGAGWSREIEIVPICHSGLRPVDLPVPINLLQGVECTDASGLKAIFNLIGSKLEAKSLDSDLTDLATTFELLSKRYVEEKEVLSQLRAIKVISEPLLKLLSHVTIDKVAPIQGAPELLIERCRPNLDALQTSGHLSYNFSVNGISFASPGSNGGGNFGDLSVIVTAYLSNAIQTVLSE